MDNKHPKSENPAMKEQAAHDKDLAARQKTTESERAARRHGPHPGTQNPDLKPK